jgi:hypothetical protein
MTQSGAWTERPCCWNILYSATSDRCVDLQYRLLHPLLLVPLRIPGVAGERHGLRAFEKAVLIDLKKAKY